MATVTLRDENRVLDTPAEISEFLAPFGIWYRRFEGTDAKVKQGFLIARDVLRPYCH